MPDNVRDAFIEDVLCKTGGHALDDAKAFMKRLETEGRFQVEAW